MPSGKKRKATRWLRTSVKKTEKEQAQEQVSNTASEVCSKILMRGVCQKIHSDYGHTLSVKLVGNPCICPKTNN